MFKGHARRHTAVICSFVLALSGALNPAAAFAEEPSESAKLQEQANSMAQKVEEATAAYQEAVNAVQDLEEQIAQNEARTTEIEAKLPEQRERTAKSIKALYLFQQSSPGLLGLILSAEDFNQFITMVRYIDTIHERNTNEIRELADMDKELKDTKAELTLEYDAAEQAQGEALSALDEARAVKRELQRRADEIAAAEAQARAEAVAAAQAAIEEAKAREAAENQAREQEAQEQEAQEQEAQEQEKRPAEATFTTSSGNTATIEVPTEEPSASTEPITNNTTSQETSGWAARIDAYLAGSPLAGYGSTFAAAAAQYGVDPRLSPAISCVESSKGAICFLPHNAWGWGSSSWSDWKTAIYDHVAGLASLYGGTLTIEGAKMYCPPTYQEWYSSVLAEMNSI